jgi:hypothetical protein
VAALPAGAIGGIYDVLTGGGTIGMRQNGSSEDVYKSAPSGFGTFIVACDGSQLVEQKISATSCDIWELGYFTATGGGGSAPTITDAGDESYVNGETGIAITGTSFGASQGSGTVKISPTDDVDDVNAVAQTVTAWGDTSVTFTCVKGSLAFNTNLYLFVTNDDGLANAAGYPVQIMIEAPRPISYYYRTLGAT